MFNGKKILITGVCGTVGSELLRQLASSPYAPREICGLDNNERGLFFQEQAYLNDARVVLGLGDVRDLQRVSAAMQGVDIVFHAAAFKHVVMCEKSPYEAVQTNIIGINNIITAAANSGVERVIFTSSDKAVNPTNVMGTSKLMGERLITAANSDRKQIKTVFASTRFGNVLGSTGSVIPIFHRQIMKGGPVTLTEESMTRFIMSIAQAVRLVIETAGLAQGGEVFITKMHVVRIADMARAMINELAPRYDFKPEQIDIKIIGSKPGEKLYEELMTEEEVRRTLELKDYFVVLPAFRQMYAGIEYRYPNKVSDHIAAPYSSRTQALMPQEALHAFMREHGLYEAAGREDHPDQRYWPGDKK